MNSLDRFAADKLAALEKQALRRTLVETALDGDLADGIHVVRDGRRLVSFSSNDYLNLTQHPKVKDAAIEAIRRYGAGAGASRLVTGNHPLFAELESRLSRLKGTEAACVFGSGYLANMGIIPALMGEGDLVLLDELSHACLWAGARMSGANVAAFRHNDLGHVEELLRDRCDARHAMIATCGVFSMDGDLAPLPELCDLAEVHDAWLLSDDAHGIGVVGGGRGSAFAHARPANVPLHMGTLSKAVGSYGGYVCASQPVTDLLKTRARTLIYSTGLPPASVAASVAALDIIENEPDYCARPLANARRFTRAAELSEAQSPIVPVIIGEATDALEAAQLLEKEGFLVVAIRPPTVPAGTARLRIAFTAQHEEADILRLAEIMRTRILAQT
jgi:8-amino-7-oxononanoate synthase